MHKSMRGEAVNIMKYMAENETQVAIGNANMNARGDIIGPGGQVVKKKEDIAAEYHRGNPRAVKQVAIKNLDSQIMTPAQAVAQIQAQNKAAAAAPAADDAKAPAKARKISDSE